MKKVINVGIIMHFGNDPFHRLSRSSCDDNSGLFHLDRHDYETDPVYKSVIPFDYGSEYEKKDVPGIYNFVNVFMLFQALISVLHNFSGVLRFGKREGDIPGVLRFGKRNDDIPGVLRFGKRSASGLLRLDHL